MIKWLKTSGPGILIAAAFIGPGTVTVCTQAGAVHGFTLLWAMLLSVIATIVLQEMAARLGLVTGKGLAVNIREQLKNPLSRTLALLLILCAIAIGNAAYEAGNISGGVLGLEALGVGGAFSLGSLHINSWSIAIGIAAAALLFLGNYKILERVLVGLVVFMSLAFLITAIATKPDIGAVFKGSFVPHFPKGSILTIVALVGTTVVPYNLFLHAALVSEKWQHITDLKAVRRDTIIAITLGGLVSMAIIICAAALDNQEIKNGADLAKSLEPVFGNYARYLIGIGLAAAGLTSAITAPLAAAFVVQGCLGWDKNMKALRFRLVWGSILLLGILLSSLGYAPVQIIKFAQVANGILLPVIAGYLLWMVNKKDLLKMHRNTTLQNGIGICIWCIALILGLRSIFKVMGWI